MQPFVSIIIPCYNDGKYIAETVASAQKQSYTACEIIVVDDHSTDIHTQKVLQELAQTHIKVITNPSGKKGVSAARNTGIEAACGKYILPLDSDDIICSTYIEKAVTVLEQNPEVRICYCHTEYFGLKRGQVEYPSPNSVYSLYKVPHDISAVFYKEDWQAVHGFDENLTHYEDASFWLSIYALGIQSHCLPETLLFYRIRKNSAMAIVNKKQSMEIIRKRIFKNNKKYIQECALEMYETLGTYIEEEEKHKILLSYKICTRIFKLEFTLRQWIKRCIGRA